jgi:ketosteroid isomerase-like protein
MILKGTLIFALMTGPFAAGEKPMNTIANESEKAVIAKVINDSICWALTKDRPLQESTMAQDEDLVVIWTGAHTTILGWRDYVKLFDKWMDPRFKATLTQVRDLRIKISRSGDVAWFFAMLDDLGEWDGKPGGDRNIRWSGVLEKRNGKWVIVQEHGSVGKTTSE